MFTGVWDVQEHMIHLYFCKVFLWQRQNLSEKFVKIIGENIFHQKVLKMIEHHFIYVNRAH